MARLYGEDMKSTTKMREMRLYGEDMKSTTKMREMHENTTKPAMAYMTTAAAAKQLGMTRRALTKLVHREAKEVDGRLFADLGLVVGERLGHRWRFQFRPTG
jgi:hypothetical protein